MKNRIIEILNNNITESKNDYNKIYEKDFDNLANELLEAINYTRCCESVKGEQVPTFDEWLRVEDIKMHQDGTFYISSERRYVELTFLINRYNSLNL
jgi:hypothetical protein